MSNRPDTRRKVTMKKHRVVVWLVAVLAVGFSSALR